MEQDFDLNSGIYHLYLVDQPILIIITEPRCGKNTCPGDWNLTSGRRRNLAVNWICLRSTQNLWSSGSGQRKRRKR